MMLTVSDDYCILAVKIIMKAIIIFCLWRYKKRDLTSRKGTFSSKKGPFFLVFGEKVPLRDFFHFKGPSW